jgi:hypothetical protein
VGLEAIAKLLPALPPSPVRLRTSREELARFLYFEQRRDGCHRTQPICGELEAIG